MVLFITLCKTVLAESVDEILKCDNKKTRNLSVAKISCNKVLFSTDAVYCAGNFNFRGFARNLSHSDDLLHGN